MKCYKHNERDAVSQCIDCGRGLCPECTNKFTFPICDQCELKRINASKQLLVKNIVIMIALFIFGLLIGPENFLGKILMGYCFAGIPWGWSILTKITPKMFLFMSWIGWIIYFLYKIMISTMIGMFVTPFKIYKTIKELSNAKLLENYTNNTISN